MPDEFVTFPRDEQKQNVLFWRILVYPQLFKFEF
jgi:hypothetical protein